MKGYDFDRVFTAGIRPGPDDVIITGRTPNDAERTYKEMAKYGCYNAVYFMPYKYKKRGTHEILEGLKLTGYWKAMMLNELEITEFYEDHPEQIKSIKEYWNGIIHHVIGGKIISPVK